MVVVMDRNADERKTRRSNGGEHEEELLAAGPGGSPWRVLQGCACHVDWLE
jgi:hypothetical protein